MKKEYLGNRLNNYQKNLAEIDSQIQQMIANRNLIHGAIQELTILMNEFEESNQPNNKEIIDIK